MNILLLLTALFISCNPQQNLQPLSQIEIVEASALFQRHIDAIGGREALEAHSSFIRTGTLEEMGTGKKNSFTIQQKETNHYYIRINLLELGVYERGFDGVNFWERTPRSAKMLNTEELSVLLPSVDFDFALHYKKWYPTILYREKAEFGGELCDILTVENHLGQREKIIFSVASGLKIGHIKNIGQDSEMVIRYGQYVLQDDVKIPLMKEEFQGDLHKL